MIRPTGDAFFLPGSRGNLYSVHYHADAAQRLGGVLYFPPFGDEMNRARRMCALQARDLAAAGFDVLVVDVFGTGDSDGDFGEARWPIWLDDMDRAWQWLSARCSGRVTAWSLRTGALLAAELVASRNQASHVMWQPVTDGSQFIDQLLRLRVAAGITGSAADRESVATLRARLASGVPIEVGGYELAPELIAEIDRRRLPQLLGAPPKALAWFDIAPGADRLPSPAVKRTSEMLVAAGHEVCVKFVDGDPFWTTIEITVAQNLIEPTTLQTRTLQSQQ